MQQIPTIINSSLVIESPLVKNINLESLYTRAEYLNKTDRVKNLTVHFMIALRQSNDGIQKYLEALTTVESTRRENKFSFQDAAAHRFTPLHLAVLMGREGIAKALLGRLSGEQINACDDKGWTPLHHAAVFSHSLFQLLVAKGAKIDVVNSLRGTPQHLWDLTHETSKAALISPVFFQKEDGGRVDIRTLDSVQVKTYLGLDAWRDLPRISAEKLMLLWKSASKDQSQIMELYKRLCQALPKLVIRKCKDLETVAPHIMELVAGQKIFPGQLITTYSGLARQFEKPLESPFPNCIPTENIPKEYTLKKLDARNVGNAGRFINFGWPNCIFYSGPLNGLDQPVIQALTPIEAGEQILVDYTITSSEVAFGRQVILGEEKMLACYADGIDPLIKLCQEGNPSQKLIYISYLVFPLDCPTALMKLHYLNLVPASRWYDLLMETDVECFKEWALKFSKYYQITLSLLSRILELDLALNVRSDLKPQATNWILQSLGKMTVLHLLKGMDLIKEAIKQPSNKDWQPIQDHLQGFLSTYDPYKDPTGPLEIDRRVDDYVKRSLNISKLWTLSALITNLEKYQKQGLDKNSETIQFLTRALKKVLQ
jgi:hypothetical protein